MIYDGVNDTRAHMVQFCGGILLNYGAKAGRFC